jgi:hypothetical protein
VLLDEREKQEQIITMQDQINEKQDQINEMQAEIKSMQAQRRTFKKFCLALIAAVMI